MGLEQTNRLTLWLRTPFDIADGAYLVTEGFYELGYLQSTKTLSHKIDVSLLKFSVTIPVGTSDTMDFNIGRYGIRDLSGIIISQPSDGIEASYSNDTFSLTSYVGFTGLLNNLTVDINGGKNPKELTPVYTFAPPFILASITTNFPYLFAQQSVLAGFYATLDVSSEDNKTHRMYMTALLNGPISNSIFYIFSTSLGLAKATDADWQFSNLSTLEISAYLPLWSSMLSWKTVFATGPQENNEGFQTFTVAAANIDSTLDYAGIIKTGIIGTVRPIDSLVMFAAGDVFFNVMNDTAEVEKGYAGIQWMFLARWRIQRDVQLSASVEQFFSAEEGADSYLSANLKVLLSF